MSRDPKSWHSKLNRAREPLKNSSILEKLNCEDLELELQYLLLVYKILCERKIDMSKANSLKTRVLTVFLCFIILVPQSVFSEVPQSQQIFDALQTVGIHYKTETTDGKVVISLVNKDGSPGTVSIEMTPPPDGNSEPNVTISMVGVGFNESRELSGQLKEMKQILTNTHNPGQIAAQAAKSVKPLTDSIMNGFLPKTYNALTKVGKATLHNFYTLIPFGFLVASLTYFGFTWHDLYVSGISGGRVFELAMQDVGSLFWPAVTYGILLGVHNAISKWKIFKDTPNMHAIMFNFIRSLFKTSVERTQALLVGSQAILDSKAPVVQRAQEAMSCEALFHISIQAGAQP